MFDEVLAVSKMKSQATACFLGRSVEKQSISFGLLQLRHSRHSARFTTEKSKPGRYMPGGADAAL
jgi:hypothetical protein